MSGRGKVVPKAIAQKAEAIIALRKAMGAGEYENGDKVNYRFADQVLEAQERELGRLVADWLTP